MRGAHSKKRVRKKENVSLDVVGFFVVAGLLMSVLAISLSFSFDRIEEFDLANEYIGTLEPPASEGALQSSDNDVAAAYGLQTRETYKNARFGYSIAVPVSFILGSEIDDGSGVMLVSSSLRMTVKIVAYNNTDQLSAADLAEELWNHSTDSIVRTEGDRVVIYQYSREYEYFIWAYVGAGSINQMTIRYPLQDDNQEELVAAQALMQNFKPGLLDVSH